MRHDFTVIIPARYGSSRLPGKPLLDIAGRPMIQWVYDRAAASSAARVAIATDDERIRHAALGFGAEVCMTRESHASGTDRLQEAAAQLKLADEAIVVNVQGDEPLLDPVLIDQVARNLAAHTDAAIATLSVPIVEAAEFFDPNAVKVVSDDDGMARYFSRAPIPWPRDDAAGGGPVLPAGFTPQRHVGIYAYRVGLLNRFVEWPLAPLEAVEKLEQLRAMYFGAGIHVAEAAVRPAAGVDTMEDLQRVRRILEQVGS